MELQHLPVEELAYLPAEIERELADLARGILPPKLNFSPLRQATLDRALAELGFARLGASWVLDIGDFRVAIEVFRDKANRAFSFDLGLQPLILWDGAVHGNYPVQTALFRGRVMLEGNRCWWKHGLERDRAKQVFAIAAEFLRSELLAGLHGLIEFCDSATPDQLAASPLWLDCSVGECASFARYRHAVGRQPEAAAFARTWLEAMRDNSPPGLSHPPSPVALEMRAILEA